MSNNISNEKEFEENLKKLSDLYEEGKDLIALILPVNATANDLRNAARFRDVLKEMRNLTAVQMQHKHFVNEN